MPKFPPPPEPDDSERVEEDSRWLLFMYVGGVVFIILFAVWFFLTYGWSAY